MGVQGKLLSEHLEYWRAERPSEWMMDEFIRDAKALEAEVVRLKALLEDKEKQDG